MRCNNKHILERNSKGGILVEGLVSCMDNKIKDNNHKSIVLRPTSNEHSQYKKKHG